MHLNIFTHPTPLSSVSIVVNIFALTVYYTSALLVEYHIMVNLIVISVMNSMACKVYRDIKFGRIAETATTSGNVRAPSTLVSLRAASHNHGDAFLHMDRSTMMLDSGSGANFSTAKAELPDISFVRAIELDSQS